MNKKKKKNLKSTQKKVIKKQRKVKIVHTRKVSKKQT